MLLGLKLENCKVVLENCRVCPLAKHTRLPFPSSTSKSCANFELLHLDVWGPYSTQTFDGNIYFLIVVDDYSRVTWVFLLKFKCDILIVLKAFFKVVKIVRSDNRGEFVNQEFRNFSTDLGILYHKICSYTPQRNGVAERKHRYILEVARAIRFQGHIPLRFWGHCILAAIYIINRLPSMVLSGKSLYELFFGRKPTISHLRTLGCLCYASVLPESDKLDPRATKAIFVGYSAVSKGLYLV